MSTKKQKGTNKRFLALFMLILICVVVIAGYFWHKHNDKKTFVVTPAHTTSKLSTAQSGYSSGDKRATSSSTSNQGGATDNNGNTTTGTSTDTSASGQSTSSTSGLITIDSPTANQKLSSGDQISGEAQVGTVQFQLIDNSSGLIASGSLSVIDGKFSGTLHFTASSDAGVLNVFSQDSPSSPEVNIASIPVGLE